MKSIDGGLLASAIPWSINAIFKYRPQYATKIQQLVNDEGQAYLEKSKDQCVADAIFAAGLTKTSKWTRSGNLASVDVAKDPQIMKALEDQRIGKLRPAVPVMVLTGTKDDTVAHGQAKQLALDWCGKGANVTYKPVIQLVNTGGLLVSHMLPLITQMGSSTDWLVERLEGKSVRSNCSVAKILP